MDVKTKSLIYRNKAILDIAKNVSEKTNIDIDVVLSAYRLYFESIISKIESIDYINSVSDEDACLSFNLSYLGKLYTNRGVINAINERKSRSKKWKF